MNISTTITSSGQTSNTQSAPATASASEGDSLSLPLSLQPQSEATITSYKRGEKTCFKCHGSRLKPTKEHLKHLREPCPVCSSLKGGESSCKEGKRKLKKPDFRPFKFKEFKDVEKLPQLEILSTVPRDPLKTVEGFMKELKGGLVNDDDNKDDEDKKGVMLTALCGRWCIWQTLKGHRVTTDDVCCAAIVTRMEAGKGVRRYLDLGTGLSSVLHMVSWGLALNYKFPPSPPSTDLSYTPPLIVGIEVQPFNLQLARRTAILNDSQAILLKGDLRDLLPPSLDEVNIIGEGEKFDLITGTPPYFPLGTGTLSPQDDRTECAFECRGDVSTYLAVVKQWLRKEGRCYIANGGSVNRTVEAGRKEGFKCEWRWDVHGKVGKDVLFSVYKFTLANQDEKECKVEDVFIRDEDGQVTEQYNALCDSVGKPRGGYEGGSASKPKPLI